MKIKSCGLKNLVRNGTRFIIVQFVNVKGVGLGTLDSFIVCVVI